MCFLNVKNYVNEGTTGWHKPKVILPFLEERKEGPTMLNCSAKA